jgi:exonuclease VII small subunit
MHKKKQRFEANIYKLEFIVNSLAKKHQVGIESPLTHLKETLKSNLSLLIMVRDWGQG